MRRGTDQHRTTLLQSLADFNQNLRHDWSTLLDNGSHKDLAPQTPLFRFNIHLSLMYHLTLIFVGRSLIFRNSRSEPATWLNLRDKLVNDCLASATAVVSLSQTLHDTVGLARCSYTEFTSCSAATVAILAQRMFAEEPSLKASCDNGIRLLKEMSVGIFSQSSERLTIGALEMAARKLDEKNSFPPTAPGGTYSQYLNWALRHSENRDPPASQPWATNSHISADLTDASIGNDLDGAQDQTFGSQASQTGGITTFDGFEIGDIASVPGLESWFDFGLQ
jgi:hypothetical protein